MMIMMVQCYKEVVLGKSWAVDERRDENMEVKSAAPAAVALDAVVVAVDAAAGGGACAMNPHKKTP